MANLERIYTIPLGDVYSHIRNKRGKRAVALIRTFALRHMKAADTRISEGTNSAILRDGIEKPPRRIKVRIVKDENAVAKVWLVGEEEKIKETAEKRKAADEAKKKEAQKKVAEKAPAVKPATPATATPTAKPAASPAPKTAATAPAPAAKPAPALAVAKK